MRAANAGTGWRVVCEKKPKRETFGTSCVLSDFST